MGNKSDPDIEKLCRLCLKEENVTFQIFDADDAVLSIPMRIMACASLEVKSTDGLPKTICAECRYQLEKSFLFRKRSQANDSKLRKHIRLLSLGKKSKVFAGREDDETDEDELEFEDSLQFIQQQDILRNDKTLEWKAQYKQEVQKELQQEYDKKLENFVSECKQKLRGEVEEKVRDELRNEIREEVKIEIRSDVAAEVRDEVIDQCRNEQIRDLLWEMEVFLNEKKARERVGAKYIIENAAQNAEILSEPVQTRKRRRNENEKCAVDIDGIEPDTDLENNEVEVPSVGILEAAPSDISDVYIISNEQKPNEEQQSFLHVNSLTINGGESQTYELTSDDKFTDTSITSYKIKDNGEIQYCESKKITNTIKDANESPQTKMLVDFCTELGDDLVELDDVSSKMIVMKNSDSESSPQKVKFVAKRSRVQSTGRLFTKLNSQNDATPIHSIENVNPAPRRNTDTVKSFACKLCPITFSTELSLERHMRSHSKAGKGVNHQCPVCQLHLSCTSALKRHMLIHTGVRPYCCSECGKAFVQREILKRHMDTHTGVRPYECPHCKQRFAQKTNLQSHINKLHLEDQKLHECHLCPKKFTHSSGLSRHLTSHSGIIYQCLSCDRQFNDRSSVKRHVSHMHGVTDKFNESMIVSLPAKPVESITN